MIIWILLLVAFVILILAIRTPRSWAKDTQGGLIGETYIKSHQEAKEFADKCTKEALSIWSEPSSNWQEIPQPPMLTDDEIGLKVEARRVTSGPLAKSGVLLTRSEGSVLGDASDVFHLLAAMEGSKILNPDSDPVSTNKNIEKISNWKSKENPENKLSIQESFFNNLPPGCAKRHHVLINIQDVEEKILVCKSIVHDSRPGASSYFVNRTKESSDDRVRSLVSLAIQVIPEVSSSGQPRSFIRIINWTDFLWSSDLMNWFICKGFYNGVYERLNAYDYSKMK